MGPLGKVGEAHDLDDLFHELVAPTFGDMVDQVDLAQYRSDPTCPLSLDFV